MGKRHIRYPNLEGTDFYHEKAEESAMKRTSGRKEAGEDRDFHFHLSSSAKRGDPKDRMKGGRGEGK